MIAPLDNKTPTFQNWRLQLRMLPDKIEKGNNSERLKRTLTGNFDVELSPVEVWIDEVAADQVGLGVSLEIATEIED